ncbi:LCP family protein [Anaerospora hongkongensis]|uniref:LCP family protein n=1 Tax=Anaerospora hongkongensis TaxID=244830 RepID=UPI0028A2ABB5|nr:LCP family protein [Anaerospora hongkongensis]
MTSRLERRRAERSQEKLPQKGWIVALLILLLVIVAGASYVFFTGGLGLNKTKRTADFAVGQHKVNILVLGVDERSGDQGRSDTMFVATIDEATKAVSLLSVPRDTRVKIPGYGWDKINHAYANGGSALSQKAVENLLGIPIDYYVTIDFAGFYKIVDAIGGVDIDVEKRMYYEDPYDELVIDIQPGLQHMNGKTAIKYVRYRDSEGDIGRIERQQKFIKAVFKQLASPSVITSIPSIIREVNSVLKTDLSTADMLSLAKLVNDAAKQGLKTDTVPGKPAYIADVSYWLPDVVGLREHIAQLQNIKMDDKYVSTARKLQAEYDSSIPKEMKVIEVAKPSTPAKEPAQPKTPKEIDKPPAPVKADKPNTSEEKIKVEIVNASGSSEAGDKIAATMRAKGFEVDGISTAAAVNKNTVVISYSTNSAVVGKLTSLPFRYALQVTKDDSRAGTISVIVGKDYVDK